jgi:hypothetical protein
VPVTSLTKNGQSKSIVYYPLFWTIGTDENVASEVPFISTSVLFDHYDNNLWSIYKIDEGR